MITVIVAVFVALLAPVRLWREWRAVSRRTKELVRWESQLAEQVRNARCIEIVPEVRR